MSLEFLRDELAELRARDLLRTPRAPLPTGTVVLCSNDYLGYAQRPLTGTAEGPSGAGASRLISGEYEAHRQLEQQLAAWVGAEAALLFSSGYAANVGVLSALTGPGDVIISDRLNHASIIDGCRLSPAEVVVAEHLDADAVKESLLQAQDARRRFVVTESYFSMDGDSPDLDRLGELCTNHDATLIVDEAHALGVFGARGRGRCASPPDVFVGTLGKAVGMQGAFVAGSHNLIRWLYNRARSFVFSTATTPALARAIQTRIQDVQDDDGARARLATLGKRFRTTLGNRFPHLPANSGATGPILPIPIGSPRAAVAASDALLSEGVFVQAIRPPTVPERTSRLRLSLSTALSDRDAERALDVLTRVLPHWLA